MKNIVILLAILIVGCSKKNERSVDSSIIMSEKDNEIIIAQLNINIGESILLDGGSDISFGSIIKGFRSIKKINIFNQKAESISINYNESGSNLGSIIVSNGCPAVLEIKRSCAITLEINSNSMATGLFNQMINVQDLEIPITGSIIENVAEQLLIQSPNPEMGQVIRGEKIERSYLIYNQTRENKLITVSHNVSAGDIISGMS